MSKISALADYLQETAIQKFAIGEASSVIPVEDRIYLNAEGLIPNVNKKPEDLEPPILVIVGKQQGKFIDKKQLLLFHKDEFETAHTPNNDKFSYGGIIINKDGMVLMRKPSGEQNWTFAKGGANEGESPEEAALREVEEETGIKATILDEIPGHYNSTNSSNKYFLMEADIDDDHIDSFKSDETDELKWMTSAEAMKALNDNENESSLKRDTEVLSSALHITRENSRQTSLNEHFKNYASNKRQTLQENLEAVADYFVTNEELPKDLKNNPQTAVMIHHVAKALVSPEDTPDETVANFFPVLFKKLDKHYDIPKNIHWGFEDLHLHFLYKWGDASSQKDHTINLMQEIIGAKYNIPHTYAYNNKIPEDTDVLGKPTYRNDEQRDEIIDTYQKWKNKEIDPSGEFSWGAAYNFKTKEKVEYSHRTQQGELVTERANPYKLMFERANSVKETRDDIGITSHMKEARSDILRRYGASYIDNILGTNAKNYSDDQLHHFGNKFLATYIDHMQTMNKQILDAIYPDTDHLIMWRKSDTGNEIVGEHGLKGTSKISPFKFGMPHHTEVDESDPGWKVRIHSTPVAGGSIHPNVWNASYAIASKVNKSYFLALHPFMYPKEGNYYKGNTHEGERESVYVVNTPETESRVIATNGNQHQASSETSGWVNHGNGFSPMNLFGKYKEKGITAPNVDYYDEGILTPATSEDSPFVTYSNKGQFGSNSGGLKKDKKGNLFYVKHEHSERNKSEVFATNIYKKAGILVPNVEAINYNNTIASKSEWLPNPITHTAYSDSPPEQLLNSSDVKDGFLIDVLVGNYDVFGANYDNIVESNGRMYRVDNGGTFQYRAKSNELKQNYHDWSGKYVDEISSMMDTQYNSGKIFSTMTDADIGRAANNLFKLTNSVIEELTEDSGFSDIDAITLKKRRNSLISWLVDNKKIKNSSVESVNNEYNILKSEILKQDSDQKKIPDVFIGDNEGRHTKKTPEEQKAIDAHNERLSRIYEKEWERVFADDDQ